LTEGGRRTSRGRNQEKKKKASLSEPRYPGIEVWAAKYTKKGLSGRGEKDEGKKRIRLSRCQTGKTLSKRLYKEAAAYEGKKKSKKGL